MSRKKQQAEYALRQALSNWLDESGFEPNEKSTFNFTVSEQDGILSVDVVHNFNDRPVSGWSV